MADSTETKALLLKIDASTELLKSNLAEANKHVATFEHETEEKLGLIDRAFEATGERVREHASEIAAGFVAFLAVEHLVDLAKEGLEYAASLKEVAEQLGTTTTFLQQFRYAAGQVGIGQEEADKALGKFTQNLSKAKAGVKETAGVFAQLGVSGADLKNLDQHEILLKTADGLARLKDGVTRAAPEVALFGKTGQLLEPLLAQGSAGINKLAQAAADLGIVLTPEQIEKAGTAAHKFTELKTVLEANIAGFVADNADAIYGLASSLERLTVESLAFIKEVKLNFGALADVFEPFLTSGKSAFGQLNTQFGYLHDNIVTLLQAIDKLANVPVKLNNFAYNADHRLFPNALSTQREHLMPESDLAGNFDRAYRARQAEAAKRESAEAEPEHGGATYHDPAAAAEAARAAAEAKRKAAALAKAAEEARVKEVEREKRVADESSKLDDAYLSAQSSITADTTARATIERDKLARETATKLADVDSQVSAKQLRPDEAAALRAQIERNRQIQEDAINQRENVALERESAQVATARLDGQKALLSTDASLATTNRERLAIALRQLALDKQAEQAKLKPYLDDALRPTSERHFQQGDIDAAKASAATLDQRYAGQEAVVRRQYQGPLAGYKEQLQESVGDTNEALQGIQVSGLESLENAFTGILSGSKSVAASIKEMVSSIVADLAKLAVEKGLLSLLSGGFNAGASSAKTASLLGSAPLHLATGGHVQGPGTGTSDSIVAKLSNGEFIVNAAATKRSLPLLKAINDNRLPRFATGGLVGTVRYPSARVDDVARAGVPRFIVEARPNPYFDTRVSQVAGGLDRQAAPHVAAAGAAMAGQDFARKRRRDLNAS